MNRWPFVAPARQARDVVGYPIVESAFTGYWHDLSKHLDA
jgi:hypothetical protein